MNKPKITSFTPFIIGLTGGIGSGKSVASKIFSGLGAYIIDTDEVSKAVTASGSECDKRLMAAFPTCVVGGKLQRALLKSYVFNNESARQLLNSITHPYIIAETLQRIGGHDFAVIQVPLLFESGFDKLCSLTIGVISDIDLRIQRVQKRDNISADLAYAIIKTQLSNEDLIRKCDYFIENNGDFAALEQNVLEVFNKIHIK